MRIFTSLLLIFLLGCSAVQPTKPVFKAVPPPLPTAPAVAKKLGIRPLVQATPQNVQPPATNVPGVASIKYLPDQKAVQVQWSARPLNYVMEVSTDLSTWTTKGTILNAAVEQGQAVVPTTAFPSGQAVVFTNGTPVIIFLDYAIDPPAKFYRVRETP